MAQQNTNQVGLRYILNKDMHIGSRKVETRPMVSKPSGSEFEAQLNPITKRKEERESNRLIESSSNILVIEINLSISTT